MSDGVTQELESYSRRRPLAVRVLMVLVLVEAIEVPLDTIRTALFVFHFAFDYLTAKQCHRIGGLSSWPVGMTSIAGKLAVCMLNTQSVHLYDVMSGTNETLYTGSPLVKPRCITALSEDTVLVSDVKQMHVITLKGNILRSFDEEGNGAASLDSQTIALCVKGRAQGIKVMRWTDGVVVRSFGSLCEPCDIVILRDEISSEFDRLIVSDFEDKSIHTFSLLGVCMRKLTNAGSVAGLAVLSRDVVAVSDVMNRVVFFSSECTGKESEDLSSSILKQVAFTNSCVRLCLVGDLLAVSIPILF